MRQRLPDLLGDERHERMQQFEGVAQDIDQNLAGNLGLGAILPQAGFDQLDIPVAEDIPDEVVQLADSDTQLELFEIVGDLADQFIKFGEHPLVLDGELVQREGKVHLLVLEVHQDETGSVPDLVGEVAAGDDLLVAEAHVVTRGIAGGKGEAQRVGAVLVDDLQRVDAVAQRLAHLSALRVADQAVEQNCVERNLSGVLQSREDHAGNPEEDDVVAGDQGVSRVEIFQLRGLVRPAQGRERPQRRAEPGVQRVLILVQVGAAALRAGGGRFLGDDHLAAVVAVVGRDAVAPPELTGDAPVLDVLHPVVVGLVHPLGNQLDLAIADNVDGRLCQRLHLDKPLLGDHRLDGGAAAVAGTDVVGVLLDLEQVPLLL